MLDAYVDCWMLALPKGTESPDTYVRSLTDMYFLVEDPAIAVGITNRAAELLQVDGCFPMAGTLPDNLWPHRRDVFKLVGAILERLPHIEESDGVNDIYAENLQYDETLLLQPRSASSLEALGNLVVRALIERRRAGESPVLIANLADKTNNRCIASCDVVLLDLDDGDGDELLGNYEHEIVFAHDLHRLGAICEPEALWSRGQHIKSLRLAFHQKMIELAEIANWPIRRYNCTFGRHFIQNIHDLNFHRDLVRARMLIRACTEVACSIRLGDAHRIRVSRGGSSEELRRDHDGATAWRRDIDHEYHLHYWLTPEGPELSNVVIHNDFSISQD